ncbi:unnamed protein product [Debaryomyces tyrocola]|nr:unnamed protein product [Debaryomyces tyrocola]
MDRKRPQAYDRLSKGYENHAVNKLQSNRVLQNNSPDIGHTNNNRRSLYQEKERKNIKKSLKILLALEESVDSSTKLNQFQKAQMNNMLLSVQSLVQSLSIQYSDVEIPDHAYRKLTTLVESVENLIYSIIDDNNTDQTKIGIFEDRITNLSPSISSRSIGGNYEDELIERTNNFHINGSYSSAYYDNDMLKKSDDEDSEFDDEEVSHLNDRFSNDPADRYRESYRTPSGIHNGIRPPRSSQVNGTVNPTSSFITPTRSTMQNNSKGRIEHGSLNPGQYESIYRRSHTPFNRGGFNGRMKDPSLYDGKKLLISQDVTGSFN